MTHEPSLTNDLCEDVARLDAVPLTVYGHRYERLRDNRWRRHDGRVVLVLDLDDSNGAEWPWRVEVDGALMVCASGRHDRVRRFSHPWNAVRAAHRSIAERSVQ